MGVMRSSRVAIAAAALVGITFRALALAQAPLPAPTSGEDEKAGESKPKTMWDEFKLSAFVEQGGTFSIGGGSKGIPGSTSGGFTNLFRDYDVNQGYTFDMAELGIKRDPDAAFPYGMGLVLTVGQDAQKNHSIGIFRSDTDAFPFRNTPWFDIQEAYVSARAPVGNGPQLKLGKFVSILGYEVIEGPSNLNYSRGYLFNLATPLTATGGIVSYGFNDWLSAQAGLVLGWDRSNTDNAGPSGTGQIAVAPSKDLSAAFNFIVGPEISGDKNPIRWLVDVTASYTGLAGFTLGFEFDYGWQANDVFLTSQGLGNASAQWYGTAAYAAYDVLKDFRVALRQEWFRDVDGVRTGIPGGVTLFSTTATLQYNIWKGLYTRGEYRHDQAGEVVFGCRPNIPCKSKSQDTLSVSLFYTFF